MDTASKMKSSVHAHGQDTFSRTHLGACTSKSVKLEHVPKSNLMEAPDVVVKVTVCSMSPEIATDVSESVSGLKKNKVLGSEGVGVVDSVGAAVQKLKKGDRVAISFVLVCGTCRRQEYAACKSTNASQEFQKDYIGCVPATLLGSTLMLGNVPGVQAEYVLVPYADINSFKLLSSVSDHKALLGVGTTVTAFHAVNTAEVKEGDHVVIWGLGPIGLQAAHWFKLRDAKK
ncbi:hypothetical protein PsorP6_009167 [Peronosclerospora sorghi]|uniref:Uncharacterized protein n=1 Tax=Peronosclerospora sorghi TaxID=230839 RepID=A0ACC0W0E1_9STRA|nr:hypothetical protein PsorP6_009167 [Peronosclerospora sorghi]